MTANKNRTSAWRKRHLISNLQAYSFMLPNLILFVGCSIYPVFWTLKYSMNAAAEWHIMLAGASIAIIPILIVYALCNKQFIEGLTAGAVKG